MPPQDSSPSSNWTGGQYSVVRALLGLWLLSGFVGAIAYPNRMLLGDESHAPAILLGIVGCLLSVALTIGKLDRWAAIGILGLQIGAPLLHFGFDFASLLVLFHALTPTQPYGSWDARGRVDPGGGWKIRADWHSVALGTLAAVCFVAGIRNGLESYWGENRFDYEHMFAFADGWIATFAPALLSFSILLLIATGVALLPIVLFRPSWTKYAWGAAFLMSVAPFLPHLNMRLAILFLLAFDPAWVRPAKQRRGEGPETIFYDGECGLCHRAVRFVLSEDVGGRFRFAPLQGEAFEPFAAQAKQHGDTMFLARPDDSLLARSDAWLEILRGVGGGWRVLGEVLSIIPRPLRDLVYDGVARVRKSLFAKPKSACPMLPPNLIERFKL